MIKSPDIIKSFKHDNDAVSEVYGYVLIIAIVMAGLAIIVLSGSVVIDDSKDSAQFSGAEQAFTAADSRISKARFSTSIFQETPFEVNDGVVTVDGTETNSYLEIYEVDTAAGTEILLSRTTLGTIKCATDKGEIAYQAGGVWAKYNDGGTMMISPPDFDYNGETLTLPIMHISGQTTMAAQGGKVVLNVKSRDTQPIIVYPDPAGIPATFNPVTQGKDIKIKIKSDYYKAWEAFINERTRATAVSNPADSTVSVILDTGEPAQSGLAKEGFNTKSMDTTLPDPILKFSVHLEGRNSGNDYFVSFRNANDPTLNIEIIRTTGGANKEEARIIVKYTDGAQMEAFSRTFSYARQADVPIDLNLLSDTFMLTYGDDDADGHPDDTVLDTTVTWSTPVTKGQQKSLEDVIQHYMLLNAINHADGPEYLAYGTDKNDGKPGHIKYDPLDSTLYLEFAQRRDLKYLYVTEGILDASLSYRS